MLIDIITVNTKEGEFELFTARPGKQGNIKWHDPTSLDACARQATTHAPNGFTSMVIVVLPT